MRGRLTERGIGDSKIVYERMFQQTGAATPPGSAFGRPPGERTPRLAYVELDRAPALLAAELVPPI